MKLQRGTFREHAVLEEHGLPHALRGQRQLRRGDRCGLDSRRQAPPDAPPAYLDYQQVLAPFERHREHIVEGADPSFAVVPADELPVQPGLISIRAAKQEISLLRDIGGDRASNVDCTRSGLANIGP